MNNEFAWDDESGQRQNVAIPSTLLISALGQIEDISRGVSMDLKQSGSYLFLVGHTRKELGGSHIALVNSLDGGSVPRVDLDTAPERLVQLHNAIGSGSVRSCHDLSEGGLAVAAAEMAFAGGIGVSLDLDELAAVSDGLQAAELLFSESPTRFLVEVTTESESTFRKAIEGQPVVQVGTTNDGDRLEIIGDDGQTLVDTSLADLKQAWQAPLDWN